MSTESSPTPGPAPAAAPAGAAALPHPLRLPSFRNLWLGSMVSMLGDQFYLVALPWLTLKLTGSSLALGTLLMIAAIPRTVFLLIGGALTDRVSPRRVLLVTAAIRMLLVATMALLVGQKVVELWHLVVITFAFGVADAFSFPAGPALLPTLVPPQQLPPANALLQSTMVLAQMAGPAPAGLVIRRWGILPALVVDAVSFLAVIVALFRIPDPPPRPAPPAGAPPRPSMLQSIGAGLSTVRQDKPLMALMVVFASINMCIAGPIGVGMASVANFKYGSPTALGTLLSSFFGGTLAGLLLGGMTKRPRRRGLLFVAIGTVTGIEMAALAFTSTLLPTAALLALMGLGVGLINVLFTTWIQRRVELALLGRVMSVVMLFAVGLMPVSYLVAGVVAEWNLPALFLGAGGALTFASLAVALTGSAVREVD